MVSGSAWCDHRWRKQQGAAEMVSPWARLVASMVVDFPHTLSFCVSRKRETPWARSKVLEGVLLGMTLSAL